MNPHLFERALHRRNYTDKAYLAETLRFVRDTLKIDLSEVVGASKKELSDIWAHRNLLTPEQHDRFVNYIIRRHQEESL